LSGIVIPWLLAVAVADDDVPERRAWLARLPAVIEQVARDWALTLGDPYLPGGQTAWVAPVSTVAGHELVLKLGWRHWEADHEADGLRAWDGKGAVRCRRAESLGDTEALLLERCVPGRTLGAAVAEPGQDAVMAGLLRRLWEAPVPPGSPFRPLRLMCDEWAASFERGFTADPQGLDPGLARAAAAALRELPRSADHHVLLCTDLHAGNVLAAQREPWLAIDPNPFVGDPAYDTVQHMLNCDGRLATDPVGLARRMAGLLDLDPDRVTRWLFARVGQEALGDATMREPARLLASALG
jgi:streptomycin 6-kinase